MTTHGEVRLWLDQFPLREAQFFEHQWNGILYPGEIIRTDIWSPDWASPLTGDVYFRIVLMVQQPNSPLPVINDSRIAVCVPGINEYRQRDQLVEELSTIRETQSLYLTQSDPESQLIRRTLQRRRQGLEEELLTREVDRYSSGRMITDTESGPVPDGLFAGPDPAGWFTNIAHYLLSRTYTSSPIDHESLPRPVSPDDPGALFEAIFPAQRQILDRPSDILAQLGPGLGLSSAGEPDQYNPSACSVLELVRVWVSHRNATVSWPDLHNYLAQGVGLTGPLATLYLLVYLHQARPELELRLADHQLSLNGGRPLPGSRLTGDLLRPLVWDPRLSQWATTLGPITQPTWNDALPYLEAISSGQSSLDAAESILQAEQKLLRDLSSSQESVRSGQGFLEIAADMPNSTASDVLNPSLRRVSSIAGGDYLSIYNSIRNTYTDYRLLEEDLAQVKRLAQLAQSSATIAEAWAYLAEALVPYDLPELSVERQTVAAAIAPDSLLAFSRPWTVLSLQVDDFKTRYAQAYREHHHQFHRALSVYRLDLEAAKLKLKALDLLNSLSELGPPTGEGLAQLLESLETQRITCSAPEAGLDLEVSLLCGNCQLTLEDSLDLDALVRATAIIDGTLGEKNRALSNLLVDKILQGQVDQRLEDFLKIVQASDLSALSNTISDEMISFIRRLLG